MRVDLISHPSGDWEGLYIDNVLYAEGHSIRVEDFISAFATAAINYTQVPTIELHNRDLGNEEGFDEDYEFPLKYEDIDGSISQD